MICKSAQVTSVKAVRFILPLRFDSPSYIVCVICASHCPYFVDKFFFYAALRDIITVK